MKKTEKTEKILAKVKQYAPVILIGTIACGITGMLCGSKGLKLGFKTGANSLAAAILYDHDEAMIKLEKDCANASKEEIENSAKLGKYVLENWNV